MATGVVMARFPLRPCSRSPPKSFIVSIYWKKKCNVRVRGERENERGGERKHAKGVSCFFFKEYPKTRAMNCEMFREKICTPKKILSVMRAKYIRNNKNK
jgi:hypothetical protein